MSDDYQDGQQEAYAHELMQERHRMACEALNRCAKAGADIDALRTLARECGIDIKYLTLNADSRTASVG